MWTSVQVGVTWTETFSSVVLNLKTTIIIRKTILNDGTVDILLITRLFELLINTIVSHDQNEYVDKNRSQTENKNQYVFLPRPTVKYLVAIFNGFSQIHGNVDFFRCRCLTNIRTNIKSRICKTAHSVGRKKITLEKHVLVIRRDDCSKEQNHFERDKNDRIRRIPVSGPPRVRFKADEFGFDAFAAVRTYAISSKMLTAVVCFS